MKYIRRTLECALLMLLTNAVYLFTIIEQTWLAVMLTVVLSSAYIFFSFLPSYKKNISFKLQVLYGGYEILLISMICMCLNVLVLAGSIVYIGVKPIVYTNFVVGFLLEMMLFINGTLRVLFTSTQLGTMRRIRFLILWWVPVINLFFVLDMARVARSERKYEIEKERINNMRSQSELCKTKYPILMVHGVFFMDSGLLNYWGRIPDELKKNGARVYYGRQQSALSVHDSAVELKKRVNEMIDDLGCEKVNIIAHSKGGLDSRYMISCLDMADKVCSLTTINTPHRGCEYAQYLLKTAPAWFRKFVAETYNDTLKKLGEESPDFLGAVNNLTKSFCEDFNRKVEDKPGIIYQSVTSKMNKRKNATFPLKYTYNYVKKFDGENDGLVSVESAKWGTFLGVYETPKNKPGISHADMIDQTRRNIKEFDVREFYVNLVKGLGEKGC